LHRQQFENDKQNVDVAPWKSFCGRPWVQVLSLSRQCHNAAIGFFIGPHLALGAIWVWDPAFRHLKSCSNFICLWFCCHCSQTYKRSHADCWL